MSLFDGALDGPKVSNSPADRGSGEARTLAARIEASAAELQHVAQRLANARLGSSDDHTQLAHWQSLLELLLGARPDAPGRSAAAASIDSSAAGWTRSRESASDHAVAFFREGEVWTIGAAKQFRLRHSKGLVYLARLLREPGRELHALDLASPPDRDGRGNALASAASVRDGALRVSVLTGAGEGIDEKAKAEYEGRLHELRLELDHAAAMNDVEREHAVAREIEWLTIQLAGAFGLGGRSRPGPSPSERARQSVSKAIRVAIDRIEREEASLGAHLDRSIRTGTFCSYDPDPSAAPRWSLRPAPEM